MAATKAEKTGRRRRRRRPPSRRTKGSCGVLALALACCRVPALPSSAFRSPPPDAFRTGASLGPGGSFGVVSSGGLGGRRSRRPSPTAPRSSRSPGAAAVGSTPPSPPASDAVDPNARPGYGYVVESIASAGLSPDERDALREAAREVAADFERQDGAPNFRIGRACRERALRRPARPAAVPGATGRAVALVVASNGEDGREEDREDDDLLDFRLAVAHRWDLLLREGALGPEAQPFHLEALDPSRADELPSLQSCDDEALRRWLASRIEARVTDRGLRVPLPGYGHGHDREREARATATAITPTLRYEVDAREVTDPAGCTDPTAFVDSKEVLVFDGLISHDLRGRLLDVVLGRNRDDSIDGKGQVWDDVNGPDPSRWVRGGLVDNLTEENPADRERMEEKRPRGAGLTAEATRDLCRHPHDAVLEFESILADLFGPSVTVSRMDGAALGEDHVTPLVANAPCHGDAFEPHVDADPANLPPSPWTDVFGRYPNRTPGRPRFVTCMVYLNDEWDCARWGAPTRIWDRATGEAMDIDPRPRRVVLMDQDVLHSVVAPAEEAGMRPRYSLVWKLILHPNDIGRDAEQSMRKLIRRDGWPEPAPVEEQSLNCCV